MSRSLLHIYINILRSDIVTKCFDISHISNQLTKHIIQTLSGLMSGVTKGVTDEIVISGMSGRFPESDCLEELWGNLMSKVDMIRVDGRFFK